MFMNLHSLPAGKHMYTAYVGDPFEGCDEYDIVAPATATAKQVIALLRADEGFVDLYGADATVAGIVDQSVGAVVWQA
jgi:hypothetical protein